MGSKAANLGKFVLNQSKYRQEFARVILHSKPRRKNTNYNLEKQFYTTYKGALTTNINFTKDGSGKKIVAGHPLYHLTKDIQEYKKREKTNSSSVNKKLFIYTTAAIILAYTYNYVQRKINESNSNTSQIENTQTSSIDNKIYQYK